MASIIMNNSLYNIILLISINNLFIEKVAPEEPLFTLTVT